METLLLVIYIFGFIVTLFAGPKLAAYNEEEDRPILAVTYLVMAIGWPVLLCYILAYLAFGSNNDDDEMG